MYLVEVPVEAGGRLVVEASSADLSADLELASFRPGDVVARVSEPLERVLDQIRPALAVIAERLKAIGPNELSVEFGLKLAAETGVVVAKGTSEVHFTITMVWKGNSARAADQQPSGPD